MNCRILIGAIYYLKDSLRSHPSLAPSPPTQRPWQGRAGAGGKLVKGGEKPGQRAEQNTAIAGVGVRWSEGVGIRLGAWCACRGAGSPRPGRPHASAAPRACDSPGISDSATRYGPEAPRRSPQKPRGWSESRRATSLTLGTIGTLTASPRVVPAGGDAQHPAHRGHRMTCLIRPHKLEDFDRTEPVSRANQAVAFANISRSSRS